MTGTGRYTPVPLHQPTEFYGSVRLGDPERLFHIMAIDPYFITQDNGAGAPIHFATTYKQLDMIHHLLNNGAEVKKMSMTEHWHWFAVAPVFAFAFAFVQWTKRSRLVAQTGHKC